MSGEFVQAAGAQIESLDPDTLASRLEGDPIQASEGGRVVVLLPDGRAAGPGLHVVGQFGRILGLESAASEPGNGSGQGHGQGPGGTQTRTWRDLGPDRHVKTPLATEEVDGPADELQSPVGHGPGETGRSGEANLLGAGTADRAGKHRQADPDIAVGPPGDGHRDAEAEGQGDDLATETLVEGG